MEYSGGAVAVEVVLLLRWRIANAVVECVPTISQSIAMYFPAMALGLGCARGSEVACAVVAAVGFVVVVVVVEAWVEKYAPILRGFFVEGAL